MKQLFASARALLAVLALTMSSSVLADDAMQSLNRFFKNVSSLRAEFVQRVSNASSLTQEESSGLFYLQRPGKFRWDYRKPYHQQIVADGEKLWVYDVDMEQVIVKPLNLALGHTPAVLLSGRSQVTDQFKISSLSAESDKVRATPGLQWIVLEPKQKDSGFERLELAFLGDVIKRMDLVDAFGQITHLEFTQLEKNQNLDANLFEFKAPQGVDVISDL